MKNQKNTQKKIKISIEPIGRRILLEGPTNGLDAILDAGIGIKSVCAGKGTCGKCRILIMDKDRKPPNSQEAKILNKSEIDHGVRLACQQIFDRDLKVYIPASSLSEEQKLQVRGEEIEFDIDPPVNKFHLKLIRASLDDLDSDFDRIRNTLKSEYDISVDRIDIETLKIMPGIIRNNSWDITVSVKDREVISIEPGDKTASSYGLAIDLGTTKIAILLVDMVAGETIDSKGIMNPQISFGEDVMSRLNFSLQDQENQKKIKNIVIERINEATKELCSKNNISSSEILEMTLVGNTAMHHLFLGLPVKQLALAPFVPLTNSPIEIKARDIGIELATGAYIYMPPPIAGFVGSDHLAMILGTGIDSKKGNYLGIDIGTNTEIALVSKGKITSVSTASGPAFEGAHIRHGMRAAPGAIEKVLIDQNTFTAEVQTINDKKPIGICGSGILDAVAELLRTGLIDRRGKFNKDNEYLCQDTKGQVQFVLARSNNDNNKNSGKGGKASEKENPETGGASNAGAMMNMQCCDKDISINQKDIVEIQLAKGAMRTGIEILLENAGISFNDIDGIIIAGAFGSYIDPKNVVNIGMFPKVSLEKISQVGNAAGVGARMMLLSKVERKRSEKIAQDTNYLELTVFPSFTDHFVASMQCPEPEDIVLS
ncbi:MAG: ASKHA domain-containing protein [Actinobacteria bacterium]|nr:ASKHA domain-containing protein [Actinomycetota bacterium]